MTEQRHTSGSGPAESPATNTGPATASNGGIAVSGVVHGGIHQHLPPPPSWPLQVGDLPPLASAFQPRTELLKKIRAARHGGADVVRTEQQTTHLLSGAGGVGKSQLAAWFAQDAIAHRTTDLVVWISASNPDQIVTTYARAAARVQAPGADGSDPVDDARSFLEWLHTTDRCWLIVLDDITDPDHLAGWWPSPNPQGWILATTRLRDDATLDSGGRRTIPVDVYTPAEAVAYMTRRLTEAGYAHPLTAIGDLAAALEFLLLALSHAAAYLIEQAEPCTTYLERYNDGARRLAEIMPARIDPDAYGQSVAVTLLLALDAADTADPAGLARPALALAAVLDPAGHPDSVWDTEAVTSYLTRARRRRWWRARVRVSGEQARQAMRLLHRYALVTHSPTDGPRAVRIHALTARAMRDNLAKLTPVAHAAAGALIEVWPDIDHRSDGLPEALRANTTTLHASTGDELWYSSRHTVLFRAGISMNHAGLHTAATAYWTTITAAVARVFGERHPVVLPARSNLALSYQDAGRIAEAITLQEQVLAASVAVLGERHPGTLTTRSNLALSYRLAGRIAEAITLQEQVLAARLAILGERDPSTLTARSNLAASYQDAGRIAEAFTLHEQVLEERVAVQGERHPGTLIARSNLALSYQDAGRIAEAITLQEQVLADSVAILGERHPNTLTARSNLAGSYGRAGRIAEAITLQEQVLADSVAVLGERHPDTLHARSSLALSYRQVGRATDAITLLATAVADMADVLGAQHPDTVHAAVALGEWTAQGSDVVGNGPFPTT